MRKRKLLAALLSVFAVLLFSTAAWATDTDGDGLSDSFETAYGTNPNASDSDSDGLNDFDEIFVYGTDPTLADTDGDGQSDGYEVAHSTDPLDPGTALDGGSACTLSGYPSSVGYALSGMTPKDGSGVMVHDGRLQYSLNLGRAKGFMRDFVFPLYYDSAWDYDGYEGRNFCSPLDTTYSVDGSGNVTIRRPPFGAVVWTKSGSDYLCPTGCMNMLTLSSGVYTETTPGGYQWNYANGRLSSEQDRCGNAVTYNYTSGSAVSVTDTRGQTHTFTYWSGTGRLRFITMADGRAWELRYNPNGQLMCVAGPPTAQFAGGIWTEFRYTNGSTSSVLNNNMIAALDGRGQAWMKAEYDASDRVTKQTVGDGFFTFDYSGAGSHYTTVTDRNGNQCGV